MFPFKHSKVVSAIDSGRQATTEPTRPVTSLGHQEGRRVFWDGPRFFELCPKILIDVQYIFPGVAKNFLGGASPSLRPPWLRSWSQPIWCFYGILENTKNGNIFHIDFRFLAGFKNFSTKNVLPQTRFSCGCSFVFIRRWSFSRNKFDEQVNTVRGILWQ